MLLPCRHAASPRPSVGDHPLLARREPAWPRPRGQGDSGGPPEGLGLRSRATSAGRTGLGPGEKIPEPGKADALLEEGRGTPSQTGDGCQCNSKERATCGCQGGPRAKPDQCPWPPPSHPSPQVLLTRARLSRDGVAAGGMYVCECSLEGPVLPGQAGAVTSVSQSPCEPATDLRPLSPRCCLRPQVDIGHIPRAEPSQAESWGLCF